MDPVWNPALEDQAVARVHRIGQKRPTTIWRLRVEGTVEDQVAAIADRKRRTGKNSAGGRGGAGNRGAGETTTGNQLSAQLAGESYSTEDVLRLFGMTG